MDTKNLDYLQMQPAKSVYAIKISSCSSEGQIQN